MKPPIIVIGMHRSGTTMLTGMLSTLGVFIGKDRDYNWESDYIRKQNDWAISTSGGAWDYPRPIEALLADDRLVDLSAQYLERRMIAVASRAYWGGGPFYMAARRKHMQGDWGWKDPRNTFTLPIWLRLYPDAKVLHIYRHGADVAASLRHRERKSRESHIATFNKRRSLYRFHPKSGGFSGSYRCANLDRAFRLWGEYMDQVRRLDESLPGRIVHVCYENLLQDPAPQLRTVVERLGLGCSDAQVAQAAGAANADRCFAFTRNDEVRAATMNWRADLERWGYGPDGMSDARDTPEHSPAFAREGVAGKSMNA